ncbi:MAG TPA: ADP-ribosylglycohydrolase family protein [Candidatus Limnocylindria bacterium]|nr:ADP-ribosylglycohydrolase family protein [Candidatus Limnocylindria bacterium]
MTPADVPSLALPLRLTGAVWGHLVGDAMGVPYEFREPEQVGEVRFGEIGTHGQPPGTWSDDGALMLALLDSLVSVGFDTEDQGRRAVAWRREGAYTPDGEVFDIGGTTFTALTALEAGTPAEEAGPTGEKSQSNGSLMRILPLALWGHSRRLTPSELAEFAMRASRVTHGHAVPQVTCALYTLVADAMLGGAEPKAALDSAIDALRGMFEQGGGEANLASVAALDEFVAWPATNEPEGRGGALNAFRSAWTALDGAKDYRETMERAIRFGHDTDTTAAIAGGLAGIRWGIDAIPAEWLGGMRGRDVAAPLVDRLVEAHGWKTSTSHPLRVDWVNLASVPGLASAPGRLGMTFLPGKQYFSRWSKDGPTPWWRDLDADVACLRETHGCDVFLLLVEDHELELTRTTDVAAAFERHGVELRRHPVVDMNIPTDRAAYRSMLAGLVEAIRAGRNVVVACRGGLGRTGTAVACLLVGEGMNAEAAIKVTRESRPKTIERGTQVEWVRGWGWRD